MEGSVSEVKHVSVMLGDAVARVMSLRVALCYRALAHPPPK